MLRLKVLPHDRVARLVTVVLPLKNVLLLGRRISIPCILALVCGQRGWRRYRATVPVVPSAMTLLPFMAPVITPARRRIRTPPVKIRRRLPVIAHGDAQDE